MLVFDARTAVVSRGKIGRAGEQWGGGLETRNFPQFVYKKMPCVCQREVACFDDALTSGL